MKLSLKQKAILYICIVFFIILALYTKVFLKNRNYLEIDTMSQQVKIYN